MKFLDRLNAAIEAFRDPALVDEAQGMRHLLDNIGQRQEFVLLSRGVMPDGTNYPHCVGLTLEQRSLIVGALGYRPPSVPLH